MLDRDITTDEIKRVISSMNRNKGSDVESYIADIFVDWVRPFVFSRNIYHSRKGDIYLYLQISRSKVTVQSQVKDKVQSQVKVQVQPLKPNREIFFII